MSSKKARRRKRRKKEEEERRRSNLSPVTLFILAIGVAIVLTAVGAWLFGDPLGPGEPPWPGAVWSPSHGHWH